MFHFPQELDFPTLQWANVIKENYYYLLLPSASYWIAINLGQKFMQDRKPLNVSRVLVWWNLLLTIFSILGTDRMLNEVSTATEESASFISGICLPGIRTSRAGLWFMLFAFSKFFEFGDTFFLVVKKKPVIFLHWYHHITVMLLTFHIWANQHPIGRYFTAMNFLVHSFMYGYYTLRALGVKIHSKIALCITTLQLSQMFIGLAISILSIFNCTQHPNSSAYFALFIYSTYAILFGEFLYESYFSRKKTVRATGIVKTKSVDIDGSKQLMNYEYNNNEIKGA